MNYTQNTRYQPMRLSVYYSTKLSNNNTKISPKPVNVLSRIVIILRYAWMNLGIMGTDNVGFIYRWSRICRFLGIYCVEMCVNGLYAIFLLCGKFYLWMMIMEFGRLRLVRYMGNVIDILLERNIEPRYRIFIVYITVLADIMCWLTETPDFRWSSHQHPYQ